MSGRSAHWGWYALLLTVTSEQTLADPVASIQQCRQLADPSLRVACYDDIRLPAAPGSESKAAVPPSIVPAPVAGLAALAVSGGNAVTTNAGFGLPTATRSAVQTPNAPEAMESRINGNFEGWQPQTRLRLANGQIWQISDGTEGAYALSDPKVRITRSGFGGFFIQIEGISQSPRVRRVE